MGFAISKLLRPKYYYGRRHDYVYYPESWTDSNSGRYYEKGYYDENGQYYDSVAFQEDGKYKNVSCHCDYCGMDTILDLDDLDGSSLRCPSCGAPMQIKSELDEIPSAQQAANTHVYNSEESLRNAFPKTGKKRFPVLLVTLAAVALLMTFQNVRGFFRPKEPAIQGITIQQVTNQNPNTGKTEVPAPSGDTVFLEKQPDGSYHVVNDVVRADRILYYDPDADSYYDEATACWLWYNTDVEPAIWQYWYEGISSDFGDYGWMEHDSDGWWIEESEGNWIKLADKYDASQLWYVG